MDGWAGRKAKGWLWGGIDGQQGEQHREHPDAHADKLHPVSLLSGSAGGVDDGQVAVHADASQQQDAAVEVGFLQHRDGFAHDGAKNPLVGPVGSPERQAEGKEQVGHSQVEQVDVGDGAVHVAGGDHQHHQPVAHHAEEEDQAVDEGYEVFVGYRTFITAWGRGDIDVRQNQAVVAIVRSVVV
uniref:Uncharacterized protein n=1 Tax=Coturnix japonica TaxID=93934 RepID=A0A8C2TMP5_COTJA